jgi:hypothetical protein
MCVHFLGGLAEWTKGVRLYLEEFKLANAESKDLWDAMARGVGTPQVRVPIITILMLCTLTVIGVGWEGAFVLGYSSLSILFFRVFSPLFLPSIYLFLLYCAIYFTRGGLGRIFCIWLFLFR